jgi:hypothetical protein
LFSWLYFFVNTRKEPLISFGLPGAEAFDFKRVLKFSFQNKLITLEFPPQLEYFYKLFPYIPQIPYNTTRLDSEAKLNTLGA